MKNIQEEVQKIHAKYGMTEMANYKIEQLCEEYAKAYHAEQSQQRQPEGRPLIQFLEELDEPERSQAIENARNSDWGRTEMIVKSKADAIENGFIWDETPEDQGWDYWANIKSKYATQ